VVVVWEVGRIDVVP